MVGTWGLILANLSSARFEFLFHFLLEGYYELLNQSVDQSYWYNLVMNIGEIHVAYDHSKGIGKFQWKDFGGKKPLSTSSLLMNHLRRIPA